MKFTSMFRRRKPYEAVTEEERIARYVYLLNTLPASVVERAHASAFKDLPPEKRREMFDELRPFMADDERETASDDPKLLAKLIRRAEDRRAQRANGGPAEDGGRVATDMGDPLDALDPRTILMKTGVMPIVAMNVVVSQTVASYFLVGAGALNLGYEPAWVGELVDPGPASGGHFHGGDGGGGWIDGGGGFGGFGDGGFGDGGGGG
jgi:uncharacterized membrane protein YgcG